LWPTEPVHAAAEGARGPTEPARGPVNSAELVVPGQWRLPAPAERDPLTFGDNLIHCRLIPDPHDQDAAAGQQPLQHKTLVLADAADIGISLTECPADERFGVTDIDRRRSLHDGMHLAREPGDAASIGHRQEKAGHDQLKYGLDHGRLVLVPAGPASVQRRAERIAALMLPQEYRLQPQSDIRARSGRETSHDRYGIAASSLRLPSSLPPLPRLPGRDWIMPPLTIKAVVRL
jgi:hypothetical protein